jgi:ribosomal protein L37E
MTELFCNECDAETEQTITRKMNKERWQDKSVDDDELSSYELMCRRNGDPVYTITHVCTVCGNKEVYEDM